MIVIYLLLLLIAIWAIIYPLTDYWQRWFSPEVIKRGRAREPKICLTFDDGPNPEVTPSVLDILAQNRIPATFFLVGKRAESSPELVKQILAKGHEIGIHTFHHRHAYGMAFKKSIATIRQGKIVLERISDRSITWFRPPWGALNLFELLEIKRLKLKVVLWTANGIDWDIRTKPAQIIERITKKLTSGCIIVIHDAGGDPGAPQNMLNTLPELIKQCQNKGYRFETLTDITGGIV